MSKPIDVDAAKKLVAKALCIFCKSSEIDGGPWDCGDGEAWQNVSCIECGERWTEIYRIHRFDTNEVDDE